MEVADKLSIKEDSAQINIDLSLYSLTAIQKACYKFTAECSIQLVKSQNDMLCIIFNFKSEFTPNLKEKIVHEFTNEILDQHLREIISKETESVRNLILAHAFSKTSLIEPG